MCWLPVNCRSHDNACGVQMITTDCEDFNVDAFTDHVFEFDNISKLDAWKTRCVFVATASCNPP